MKARRQNTEKHLILLLLKSKIKKSAYDNQPYAHTI